MESHHHLGREVAVGEMGTVAIDAVEQGDPLSVEPAGRPLEPCDLFGCLSGVSGS
ncbi:MAG: hypothetical protein R2695_00470 [Acidimicrobiales bacterium]